MANVGAHLATILTFGAMSAPLRAQLKIQGFDIDAAVVKHCQRDADAITRLLVRHMLSEGEAHKARRRLLRWVGKSVKPRAVQIRFRKSRG